MRIDGPIYPLVVLWDDATMEVSSTSEQNDFKCINILV
jgi:hypothetical protein